MAPAPVPQHLRKSCVRRIKRTASASIHTLGLLHGCAACPLHCAAQSSRGEPRRYASIRTGQPIGSGRVARVAELLGQGTQHIFWRLVWRRAANRTSVVPGPSQSLPGVAVVICQIHCGSSRSQWVWSLTRVSTRKQAARWWLLAEMSVRRHSAALGT